MVFPKTLCDDISSSELGAIGMAFSPFLPLFGNSNNWFGDISSCFLQSRVLIPGGANCLILCLLTLQTVYRNASFIYGPNTSLQLRNVQISMSHKGAEIRKGELLFAQIDKSDGRV
ncbi:hypothetical protein AVEN_28479-1 [Araneus ventricosus]|uniref:Uncharacterized protein n=1 Tax=Araneus ventricosus TaxID=182803 RepID=A0A4Y2J1H8_ARAVE|nr:hypothetical protein AVEN_28479-1 [Araneus ventricosus]